MSNANLIKTVATELNIPQTVVKQVVESFLANVINDAKANGEVALFGFGKFKVSTSKARTGRNPSTGEPIEIPAMRKISFSPAKPVKVSIQTE